jgi:hypothetical protein
MIVSPAATGRREILTKPVGCLINRKALGCILLNPACCPAQLPLISLDAAEDGKFSMLAKFPICDES